MSRHFDPADREPVEYPDCAVIHATAKALLVNVDGEDHWVPRSLLGEGCELDAKGDEGTLIVPMWWARKAGLHEDD